VKKESYKTSKKGKLRGKKVEIGEKNKEKGLLNAHSTKKPP
jgi:hypothetical protein